MPVLALLLLTVMLPVQAAIYHWTDDEGRRHYAQSPPTEQADRARKIDGDLPVLGRMQGGRTPTGIAKPRKPGKVTLPSELGNGMRCGHYRDAVARIDSKLRAGYRVKEGRKLMDRRRHYTDWMFRNCR